MDIKPGDTCIFDPYNHFNQKQGYNDVVVVTITKVNKALFKPTTVDFFDTVSNRLFEKIPVSCMYKINNPVMPNIVIRYKPGTPLITERDVDLVRYCIEKIDDKDVKEYAKVFYQKLKLYMLSPLFTDTKES
ncbi:MAG: hypothetical protein J6Y02_09955 [Pseudobutyrivibrio sp.]|nr:hypothetical protein [Pseudobutyrivibrio sp.]